MPVPQPSSNTFEKYILDNKPKSVLIYQNVKDIHHYKKHFLPFKDFVSRNKLQRHIHLTAFEYKSVTDLTEVTQHGIRFPGNKKHEHFLREFIKKISK